MKRVAYAGESFLTTDGVADALVRFVAALALTRRTEMVQLPALAIDGRTILIELVVGPTSELMVVPEATTLAEPDIGDAVASLGDRTLGLSAPPPVTVAEPYTSDAFDWDDYDTE